MEVDVRCDAAVDAAASAPWEIRCQLYAGHDGDHALIAVGSGSARRELWRWGGSRVTTTAVDHGMPCQLPWAPGYPWVVSAAVLGAPGVGSGVTEPRDGTVPAPALDGLGGARDGRGVPTISPFGSAR